MVETAKMSQNARLEQLVADLSERITRLETTVASLNKVVCNYRYDDSLKKWAESLMTTSTSKITVDCHLIKTGKLSSTVDITVVFVDPYENTADHLPKLKNWHANKICIVIVDRIKTEWINEQWVKSMEEWTMKKLLAGDGDEKEKEKESDEPPPMDDQYVQEQHENILDKRRQFCVAFGFTVVTVNYNITQESLWKQILSTL